MQFLVGGKKLGILPFKKEKINKSNAKKMVLDSPIWWINFNNPFELFFFFWDALIEFLITIFLVVKREKSTNFYKFLPIKTGQTTLVQYLKFYINQVVMFVYF